MSEPAQSQANGGQVSSGGAEKIESSAEPGSQVNGDTEKSQSAGPDSSKPQVNGASAQDAEKQNHNKLHEAKEKPSKKQQKLKDKNNPPGGYDATPIPSAPNGYTIKFTFHRAKNLPASDVNSRSNDPFLTATLTADLQKRHKGDPEMTLRTPTVHKNTDPEWNTVWIVAGIPSTGFRLKCRLYDEDPGDHDDRLGNVTVYVGHIGPQWPGIKNDSFDIKKRIGSKRAYMVRGCAALLSSNVNMGGKLYLSAEMLGESEGPHGRMYTVGATSWFKHYSPMIGRIAGTKAPGTSEASEGGKSKAEKHESVSPLLKF